MNNRIRKKVLITGAFGFVGRFLIDYLKNDYQIVCLVRKNRKNMEIAKKYNNVDIFWGDLLNIKDISNALAGCDFIVHLAFTDPDICEKNVQKKCEPNVTGCKNLLEAISNYDKKIKLIFASSVVAYFYEKLQKNNDEFNTLRYKEYAKHKIECEKIIAKSSVSYCILRIGAILPNEITKKYIASLPKIPLKTKFEFICIDDLMIAIGNAMKIKTCNRMFLIGGGKDFRMYYEDFLSAVITALKIGMDYKLVNVNEKYYSDWFRTAIGQKTLKYQKSTFKEYLKRVVSN